MASIVACRQKNMAAKTASGSVNKHHIGGGSVKNKTGSVTTAPADMV